ncbi:hypothetical protein [Sanguibacter sp. 25GB23B1]|uniref:hypothetical protein n=1 Tax=unclassified Sanguibacter TaxID=2645534 RepID=UPI0032AEEB6F
MTAEHAELQKLIEKNLREALQTETIAAEVLPRLEALVGIGTSQAGVRSTVNHSGIVTDLAFSEASVGLPLDELRSEVLTSVRTAITDVQEQAAPLQSQLAVDARPLDDMSVLDSLDRIMQSTLANPASRPTGGSS